MHADHRMLEAPTPVASSPKSWWTGRLIRDRVALVAAVAGPLAAVTPDPVERDPRDIEEANAP